ncbi:aminotransferase class I/II-fold pyridoxal phosphate-dependent enzyme [Cocleimonas flava]|uniref:dTDP-4-amino-4,6-dideoxygalactose transaminase n=1 Tax=Cocleimonas flava TaxID=634765 RepID=A0A4R1ERJ2_9GAMM|nr:aminotransferase class I/II-fold pyridoxal phosphate-dependent enzyme [Cocleimonas flava]TCJ83090.1 dTDP-4-amino-4,6-dideoxygalactose transaminase [Cocleimonas flava]
MNKTFNKSFTQQETIPEAGIERAVEILRGGRLHRYNVIEGETSETALLEQEYAEYQGSKYCLACASGGYALHIALKAAGMQPGEPVITNAFTLAPVPGAIDNAGGKVVLAEIDENYCVDLKHLEEVMQSSKSRFFMMSHMRGHLADMDAVTALCDKYNVMLIEDCAHTMGASWNGKKSGSFGKVACFSTQTYKHMNSGEGGLLISDDPEIMARAIMHSGSYMLYERHLAAPDPSVFKDIKFDTPNYSGRMDNLRASILRVQLPTLDENCKRWNDRYYAAEQALAVSPMIELANRPEQEYFVGSSIQFRVKDIDEKRIPDFIQQCAERGVELKWFGGGEPQGFTSRFDSWRYIEETAELPQTLKILSNTFDLRIPLTFDLDDMTLIASIIIEVLDTLPRI